MAFVVSEGSVRGMSRPSITPVQKISLSPWVSMEYFELWRRQPSVRRTVSFLGRNIAQLGIHMFERRGDNDRRRLTEHPLARLLQQPNGFTTRYRFLNTLVHDFAIYDCAYWWKVKAKDGGRQLVHLPAPLVTPKGDNWLTPEEFEFRGTKGAPPRGRRARTAAGRRMAMDPLTDLERAILDLEQQWWATAGGKDEAITAMGLTPTRYYQLLNRLLTMEKAIAYAAMTVHRLQRIACSP